jgi:hypothetical protein
MKHTLKALSLHFVCGLNLDVRAAHKIIAVRLRANFVRPPNQSRQNWPACWQLNPISRGRESGFNEIPVESFSLPALLEKLIRLTFFGSFVAVYTA